MPVRFIDKPCDRCGIEMHAVSPAKKYCPACRREIERQKHAERYRRKDKTFTTCYSCRTKFRRDGNTLCPACREKKKGMPVICEGCGITFRSTLSNPPKKCPECREKDLKFSQRRAMRESGISYEKPKSSSKQHRKLMPWEKVGHTNPGIRYGKAVAEALLIQQQQEMEERRKEYGY